MLTLGAWTVALFCTTAWDWGGSFETVAKIGALLFFVLGLIGLLRFVYAFLFVDDSPAATAAPTFPAAGHQSALPPQNPLTDYPQRSTTREMAPRASVTENTTKLLDEN